MKSFDFDRDLIKWSFIEAKKLPIKLHRLTLTKQLSDRNKKYKKNQRVESNIQHGFHQFTLQMYMWAGWKVRVTSSVAQCCYSYSDPKLFDWIYRRRRRNLHIFPS